MAVLEDRLLLSGTGGGDVLTPPDGTEPGGVHVLAPGAPVGAAPVEPSQFVATPLSSDAIELKWKDNATDEDPAAGYHLERAGYDGNYTRVATQHITLRRPSDKTAGTGAVEFRWYTI